MSKKLKKLIKNKKTPIILGTVLALFVSGIIFLLIKPNNEVKALYNSSAQIKAEYKLAGTTLVREAIDENNVRAVIGEEKTNNFEPRILLTRWDGEVEFEVKSDISNIPLADRTLTSDGNKIILDTPKVNYQMYELPKTAQMKDGGYEFEITLKEKPLTNVVSLDIDTQNLEFFHQPPLNQEKQRPGETCTETQCFNRKGEEVRLRPENVVGSYAVYYENRKAGDYSQVGGKNYKTGKAFHIYRPRVEDAAGKWVWGNLNVDVQAGKLTVTIPQEFLDNAVYPVRHAAGLTIGYDTDAQTGWSIADTIAANRFQATASGNANPGIMHIYCSSNSGTANAVFGVYSDNSGTVDSQPKISTTENVIAQPSAVTTWVTDTAFVWTGITVGTDYWLAINGHDNFRIYYDASGPGYNDSEYDSSIYTGTAPATFPGTPEADPGTIGIYLTYAAAGGGWSTTDGQIQVNHGTIRVNHGVVRVNKEISGGAPAWACGDALVDSRDSKSYATVLIGTQCWMAQGLNVGTRINGGTVQDGYSGTTCTSIDKYCYSNTDANCDSTANPTYPDGGLYQWDQTMCGSTTQGVQGICPTGWHIPTDTEWYTLESYLWTTGNCSFSRVSQYDCDIAGTRLKPGGNSGFGGNLAGWWNDGGAGFEYRTSIGAFESSTQYDVDARWLRDLSSADAGVDRYSMYKEFGLSVRCIKDGSGSYADTVKNTLDDGYEYESSWTTNQLAAGNAGVNVNAGVRFIGITIPSGATITSAVINLYHNNGSGLGTVRFRIRARNSANAAIFDGSNLPSGVSLTSNYADWSYTNTPIYIWRQTSNVKDVVQELVTNYGGLSNAAINFAIMENGSDSDNYSYWADIDDGIGYLAELIMSWTY